MSSCKRWIASAAAIALLVGVTACGGGDDDGGGGGGGGGLEKVEASQQAADNMVEEVNELVLELRSAETSGQVPTAAHLVGLPIGATTSGSMACSEFGTSGSGSMDYVYTYEGSRPVSWVWDYNDCNYTISGYTYHMDGSFSMVYDSYTNAENHRYTFVYDLVYEYSGGGFEGSYSIESRQSCVMSGGELSCTYTTSSGDYDLTDWDIEIEGDTVTVVNATIVGADVTIVFDDWTYNSTTGHAISGSVLITDGDGNSAEIVATGTGYTVEITVGGSTTSWTVTYS